MSWITPIYDRTDADLQELNTLKSIAWDDMTANEKSQWLSGLKGALNKKDLERIQGNIQYIADENNITIFQSAIPDVLTKAFFLEMLSNLQTLVDVGLIYGSTPQVPSYPINTYSKVNDVERILFDIYTVINSVFAYTSEDDIECGFDVGFIL